MLASAVAFFLGVCAFAQESYSRTIFPRSTTVGVAVRPELKPLHGARLHNFKQDPVSHRNILETPAWIHRE